MADLATKAGVEGRKIVIHTPLIRLTKAEAGLLDTLAAALAEAGRFDEAVQMAGRARELALAKNQSQLAERIAKRQGLYQQHQPYRNELN